VLDPDAFLRVSQLLTGVAVLDPAIAAGHRQRIEAEPAVAASIEALVGRVASLQASASGPDELDRQIRSVVLGDPALRTAAVALVVLWYTAELRGGANPGTPETWFGGLFWQVARAHPPAQIGGYFGHWAYPPDN
jgi:hypothetical protein